MATNHLTEPQLARDLHGVLDEVRKGSEIVVEENSRPVALIKPASRAGRTLSECISLAKAEERRFAQPPVPDLEFAADVRAAVAVHDKPYSLLR
jgi:antitoxin (DNA-binding transcriptional repressor) of toxin-antitoxin stability system